jgi:hypothetical protein
VERHAVQELSTNLLCRACRIFLALAYPEGEHTIPANRAAYLRLEDGEPIHAILRPPLCQTLEEEGRIRGYALRLGSAHYPHLKLQVINCDHSSTWVFAVDTHDSVRLRSCEPDADRLARLQAANRRLKEQIERAWEATGVLTFNALLRRDLDGPPLSRRDEPCPEPAVATPPHSS